MIDGGRTGDAVAGAQGATGVRLDRWLWAARFFRSRQQALEAIRGGKVHVGGERVKPARLVRVGDELEITREPWRFRVIVTGLAERRGPAEAARALYRESEDSVVSRAETREQLRVGAQIVRAAPGRPTKRDRRRIDRFRGA